MFLDISMLGLGALVCVVIFLYIFIRGNKVHQNATIPGLKSRGKSNGNLQDIKDAGSFHEFLLKLHKDFGSIAGFWFGEEYVISIASPSLWKDIQGLFDRPKSFFQLVEPIITMHSIQYANGELGQKRHKLLTSTFGHEAIIRYYPHLITVAEDVAKHWDQMDVEEHINLENVCFNAAIRMIMLSAVGPYFENENKINTYRDSYYIAWNEMERRLDGVIPEEGSERDILLKTHLAIVKKLTTEAIEERKGVKVPEDEKTVIDNMLESGYDEEVLYADMTTTLVAGTHTSGLLLTWSLYFMAKYPEIQEKVYQEMKQVLGEETVIPSIINQLVYTKQVLDETLRCAVIAPWGARVSEVDQKIGEYIVPKRTPIMIPFGVVHQDPNIWPDPERFDPNRFEPGEMKNKPPLTFEPFGFAGKRKCPGYRFSYIEVTVILSTLLRRFKFHLVQGQDIHFVHGLVTHPDKDIYVTISNRQ